MATISLYAYVEDEPSVAVAKRILTHVNQHAKVQFKFRPGFPDNKQGFGNIKRMLPALITMARRGLPSLIISDLDRFPCSPALIRDWMGLSEQQPLSIPKNLIFRIAEKEIESWIMADRDAFSEFIGIPRDNFVLNPDLLKDPKQHLLNVIRKKGRKKWQKEMLPQGKIAAIGPRYNEKLCEFVSRYWNPMNAAKRSPSLAKALDAFQRILNDYPVPEFPRERG